MKKDLTAILFIILITSLTLGLIFKPILKHPNEYLYSNSGDAIKSYYNFSYYLKHDSGIKHDGINYPYGDHLQYINSHPLYLQVLQFVDRHIHPLSDYGVGILNLTMLFSLIIAGPFIFLVLRKFSLPRWYAGITAIIILFLNPQFDRIHGHFEMVYAFFIPMFWYLLIRFQEGRKRFLWGALLVLSSLIGGFTSAYYAAFFAIFILSFLLVQIIKNIKNFRSCFRSWATLLLIAVIPLLVVKGFVSMTDWATDRPNNPWGFFVFHATFLSIFFPFTEILKPLIANLMDVNFQWEGKAYIGLPATMLALSILFCSIPAIFFKKKGFFDIFFSNGKLNAYLAASFLVLLFSMCIPFKYGFEFLLEVLPPIKQFRALGRFSWIFYYVFTVFAAHCFYVIFQEIKNRGYYFMGYLSLILVLFFWGFDAEKNIQRSTDGLFNKNNMLKPNDPEYFSGLKEAGVNSENFQAILFVPFANTCGDKLLFERGHHAFSQAMKCSFHTGIPIVQSFSPRLSFAHALSSIQMLADPGIRKTRLEDMNKKPLLLLCTEEIRNRQEAWLVSKGKLLWKDEAVRLYELPLHVFENSHSEWLKGTEKAMDGLTSYGNLRTNAKLENLFYEGFEKTPSKITFSGVGALYVREGEVDLYNNSLPVHAQELEISFWLYVDPRKDNMPQAVLSLWDEKGKLMEKRALNTREVHNIHDRWVRISTLINPQPGVRYQLTVNGEYISVDDLLMKPAKADVHVTIGDNNLFNNFPYPG